MDAPAYVYVLKLNSGKLYVGSTGVLLARIEQHLNKRGADATRNDAPKECVVFYPCRSRAEAYTLESYLQHQQKYTHAWTAPSVTCGADVVKLHARAREYRTRQLERRERFYEAKRWPAKPKIQVVRGAVRLSIREVAQQALERFIERLY